MPDPRTRTERADEAIAGMFKTHGNDMDSFALGLVAVAQAILATAETPPEAVRIGHWVPVHAWNEIVIKGLHGMRWAVYSTTLGKNLEEFDNLHDALVYRDHLIQNYDRQGA